MHVAAFKVQDMTTYIMKSRPKEEIICYIPSVTIITNTNNQLYILFGTLCFIS